MFKLITEPNPILHQKCLKVARFDDNLEKLVNDMAKILFDNRGIGLSAPQVGKLIKLIIIEYNPDRFEEEIKSKKKKIDLIPFMVLVNPKITNLSKEQDVCDEGCLSLPGVEIPIKRAGKVTCLAFDLQGNRQKIRARGMLARIIQHEIDHLNGILITDKKYEKI